MRNRRLVMLVGLCSAAFAHSGEPLEPHDLWTAWTFDPSVVISLLVAAILFGLGARMSRGITRTRVVCFWTGWIVLALSLVSPLHPLGESLFSAHMTQHELLMLAAAPLFVLSRPLVPMLWGLPMGSRKTLGQWSKQSSVQKAWHAITRPLAAWSIHAVALWLWHVPRLFEATLDSDAIHSLQHVSFLGSALLFWWSLFYADSRTAYGANVLYVFTTAIHTSILGALLTFSHLLWYPAYSSTTAQWGLSPLEDQQIGGLIMWVPAGLVYLTAGLAMFALWLRESDLLAQRQDHARRRYAQ